MMKKFAVSAFILSALISLPLGSVSHANNLTISNVALGARNPTNQTIAITFDVSWENSWKTKINHDAIWLTIRLYNPSSTPTDKRLCQITADGSDPQGTSTGSNSNLEIYVPQDRYGAFLRPDNFGLSSSVTSTGVELTVDYESCGFTQSDDVYASVFGIEMVYIPEAFFYAGDNASSTAAFVQGSGDTDSWYISNDSAMSVSSPAADGYMYVSASNSGETATGANFTIPAGFPNGYNAFYAMKYEINEGQWVEFVNSLGSASARSLRDITDGSHKNSDTVRYRNTISCSGSPLTCTTSRPYRPVSYLNWMDLAAFLDWAALRPLSELEFEKMARGPVLPVNSEFAWGTTNITEATAISGGAEDGSETVSNVAANVNYNNITFTGGDSASGADYAQGPLRNGIFARSSSDRETAGAGYYGVMELSGNLKERAVTVGNSVGINFQGTHGDGVVTTTTGYEGNATNSDWPGTDVVAGRGVTGADGSGYRGGAWDDAAGAARLKISDRQDAANASTSASNNSGGRGVRSYEE